MFARLQGSATHSIRTQIVLLDLRRVACIALNKLTNRENENARPTYLLYSLEYNLICGKPCLPIETPSGGDFCIFSWFVVEILQ